MLSIGSSREGTKCVAAPSGQATTTKPSAKALDTGASSVCEDNEAGGSIPPFLTDLHQEKRHHVYTLT